MWMYNLPANRPPNKNKRCHQGKPGSVVEESLLLQRFFHSMQTGNTFFLFFFLFLLLGFAFTHWIFKICNHYYKQKLCKSFQVSRRVLQYQSWLSRPKDRLFALHSLSPHTVILEIQAPAGVCSTHE